MSKTSIEWTEQTWNPIVGCSIVSPGCTNCYAMKMAARIEAMGGQPRYDGTTRKVNGNAIWTGKLAQAPDSTLLQPLKRHAPTTYFVNSMGDLFHEDCPDEWIDRVFEVMALSPQHTFQVLTKRAGRMRDYIFADDRYKLPHPNIWLGVSTERQQEADERIPLLLQTPAAVRFISAEPLLGHVDISDYLVETAHTNWDAYLDWVIVGGESGPGARPMDQEWALSLRDQCQASSVPFFFKQWGAFVPEVRGRYRKASKKAAGRLLDGIEHNGMPRAAA
jgi:protein gp37